MNKCDHSFFPIKTKYGTAYECSECECEITDELYEYITRLKTRIEELERDREFYRALLSIVQREYVGYTDPEPVSDDHAICMMAMEFKDELPHQVPNDR